MSIHKKLANIRAEFEVEKEGILPENKGGKEYWRAEDLVAKARDLFNQHGIVTTIRNLKAEHRGDIVGEGANARYRPNLFLQGEFVLIDTEDGAEFTIEVIGEGSDVGGDSSSPKAMTQFRKIALLHLFYVSEPGMDSDFQASKDDAEHSTEVQPSLAPSLDVEAMRAKVKEYINGNAERNKVISEAGREASGGRSMSEWSNDAAVLAEVIKTVGI